MTNPIVLIVGTRPEGIKMIPLYFALKERNIPTVIVSTAQHSELLQEVYELFGITPDYNLNVMKPNQDLFHITCDVLTKTKELFNKINPKMVAVQGDTTSSMAAALAAFYLEIPVCHVEAGLRTYDMSSPFPEEMNRQFISKISSYHFAPTHVAVKNLSQEMVDPARIFCTGNTIVDALRIIQEKITDRSITIDPIIKEKVHAGLVSHRQLVLLTIHRRESFNGGILRVLQAVKDFAQRNPDIFFIYPFHPNPRVLEAIEASGIGSVANIYLSQPLPYKELVYILTHAHWVATDSGGIQEEAISLGKQVLVLREKTERTEGIEAGYAQLVGSDPIVINEAMANLSQYTIKSCKQNTIYGDGFAAQKIADIIEHKQTSGTRDKDINILHQCSQ